MSGFAGSGKARNKAAKGAAVQGLAAELRETAAKAQAAEERREKARRRREERKQAAEARAIADRIIAELPEKMRQAAKKGESRHIVFQWLNRYYRYTETQWQAWELVRRHVEQEMGLKTGEYREDPFGSDPMFDYPVWTLWIAW